MDTFLKYIEPITFRFENKLRYFYIISILVEYVLFANVTAKKKVKKKKRKKK